MLHSLIIGFGLAGMAYAEQLRQSAKDFRVIYQADSGSSLKAAGIFNPTILKRYTMAWEGLDFYREANLFYSRQAARLGTNYFQSLPICKVFANDGDHNRWLSAAGSMGLDLFLDPKIYQDSIPNVKTPHGYGQVNGVGRLDIPGLQQHLIRENPASFMQESFEFDALTVHPHGVEYKGIKAQQLIFCQGFQAQQNPFFPLPALKGCKGEFFIVEAPQWPEDKLLKSSIFIVPLGSHRFWVGATFDWKDKGLQPTVQGKEWLVARIDKLIQGPYTILHHQAQIRPTVSDRRPLLEQHSQFKRLYAFNGLGTRGVLMAPRLSRLLVEAIDEQKEIPVELTPNRSKE
ncbi:MAG: NAD(P)/FAD-dependent oxidoreductase [Flavobacteriaceae bacterium]